MLAEDGDAGGGTDVGEGLVAGDAVGEEGVRDLLAGVVSVRA